MISLCLRASRRVLPSTTRAINTSLLRSQLPASRFSSLSAKMSNLPKDSSVPGEQFEVRQTHPGEDYTPDPSKSLKLSPARQRLVEDIIALYSCEPTIERVKRYTPDCVYDDQFVYANDRYKMAGQWFALPKLFSASKNERYQIVVDDPGLIQFRNEQVIRRQSLDSTFCKLPILTQNSPGPSRSSRRPPPSMLSCPFPSTRPPRTPISSRSNIIKIRPTTRTTRMKALASVSRNGRLTRS